MKYLLWLNPLLQLFGGKIVPSNLGFWQIIDGKLTRTSHQIGWRLARRAEWQGLPDNATELDRFVSEARNRGRL